MALTKRVYVDGETIITAQNLNDIQDEIISQGNTLVPKTRTINSKALSSNITLSASDVGAVPTTRTVNSKVLSSNITLTSGDIGYNSSTTYSSGTVGKAVSDLNGAINAIGTVPIAVAKGGTGANNVRDAQINLSTLSVYQLNRTKTLTVDISEYNACMFIYFGKYGDEPLFKMFGSNGGVAVYKSFDDGGASSDLTVTSNNGILSVKAPNYCDGVACQVFPFTRKFTINVS